MLSYIASTAGYLTLDSIRLQYYDKSGFIKQIIKTETSE
jgi:hypothetical protein